MPPGVRFRELSSLIDFIYNGKVQIASEDLNSFLALAKQFKIKGLTEDTPGATYVSQIQFFHS